MKHLLLVAVILVSASFSEQFSIVRDIYGEEYYLVPSSRQRRDTTFGVNGQGGQATGFSVGQAGDIASVGGGVLSGEGFISKTVSGPNTAGGTLQFSSNNPMGASIQGTVAKTPSFGHDVALEASKPLYNQGGVHLDAYAGVNQHFGGVQGNQHAEGNAGIRFEYRPPSPTEMAPDALKLICVLTKSPSSC